MRVRGSALVFATCFVVCGTSLAVCTRGRGTGTGSDFAVAVAASVSPIATAGLALAGAGAIARAATGALPSDAPSLSMPVASAIRSEEHTSELQSLRHLVCRL